MKRLIEPLIAVAVAAGVFIAAFVWKTPGMKTPC